MLPFFCACEPHSRKITPSQCWLIAAITLSVKVSQPKRAWEWALPASTVNTVFSDFEYHRTFFSEDGLSVTLEFSAKVGDKGLKGVDIVRFNAEGKMLEFEVMVRPMSGLNALAQQMGAKLAPHAHLLGAK